MGGIILDRSTWSTYMKPPLTAQFYASMPYYMKSLVRVYPLLVLLTLLTMQASLPRIDFASPVQWREGKESWAMWHDQSLLRGWLARLGPKVSPSKESSFKNPKILQWGRVFSMILCLEYMTCLFNWVHFLLNCTGVQWPGQVGSGVGLPGLQRLRFCLWPDWFWQDLHYDGKWRMCLFCSHVWVSVVVIVDLGDSWIDSKNMWGKVCIYMYVCMYVCIA